MTGVGTASWTNKFPILNQHLLENSEFPEILVLEVLFGSF